MTELERKVREEEQKVEEKIKKIRLEMAKEMFPDLQNNPYVEIPIRCKLPWWLGFGHKRHFYHHDKYGIVTSLWVCLRCGLTAFRVGGGELGDWWDIKQGYTNPDLTLTHTAISMEAEARPPLEGPGEK